MRVKDKKKVQIHSESSTTWGCAQRSTKKLNHIVSDSSQRLPNKGNQKIKKI